MTDDNATVAGNEVDGEYDAVLFDLDGVLLQGPATPAAVYQRAADDVITFFDLSTTDQQCRTLGKYHYDSQLEDCCHSLDVDPASFWAARERFASRRANRRMQGDGRQPYPDTAVLDELQVPLGIVSNNRQATVTFVADYFFEGLFPLAIGRERTPGGFARRKPESYYLEQALDRLDEHNPLYVGDRVVDVQAATGAGLDTAFIRREHNGNMNPDPPPAFDIDSLAELPGIVD